LHLESVELRFGDIFCSTEGRAGFLMPACTSSPARDVSVPKEEQMRADTQQTPQIVMRAINSLRPHASNARQHSKRQIRQIADSIRRFGFTNPILICSDGIILAGHGRIMAAKELGIGEVPTLALDHMTSDERRAYVLADNKLALNAGWDQELLASELQALIDLDFDVSLTGFAQAEIDQILADLDDAATD
jgi:ParB-like chromosome segregation protein Spo0J